MKKLDHKQCGPLEITAKIGSHTYRVNLPMTMKGIHDIFHVALLERVADEHFSQRQHPPPPPVEVDSEQHYEVAEVLDSQHI